LTTSPLNYPAVNPVTRRWYQYSLYPHWRTLHPHRRHVVSLIRTFGVPVKESPAIIRTDIVTLRCGIVDNLLPLLEGCRPHTAPQRARQVFGYCYKCLVRLLEEFTCRPTYEEVWCDRRCSSAPLGTSPNGSIGGDQCLFTPWSTSRLRREEQEITRLKESYVHPRRNGRYIVPPSQHLLRRCSLLPMG